MPHKPLLIIQMGRPPEDLRQALGEQGDWMRAALDGLDLHVVVVNPEADDALPAPDSIASAVVTGSWAMVTDREPWSERTAAWLRDAMAGGVPLLGVCYGHQLMAHAFGGVVDFHPQGREIGQHPITLSADARHDALLGSLPATFHANLTHEQTVLTPPPGAVVLGRSAHDPHQILRYGPHALSVQFHPEFFPELMAACLVRRADTFKGEGFDVDAMMQSLETTKHARDVLRGFATATASPQVLDVAAHRDALPADDRAVVGA